MKTLAKILMIAVLSVFWASGYTAAYQFGFDNITNNNSGDALIGEAQLKMDVTQQGNNVLFMFTNTGTQASSITDIYFDDDIPLLKYINFVESTGVSFTVGAAPPNLPGGQDPAYHFSSNYAYDSDNPTQPKGVNPGESLGILFSYENNANLSSLLAALDDENFRVGIHVQGFASGGSESFINNTTITPEPATMLLLGFGLIGVAALKRKVSK